MALGKESAGRSILLTELQNQVKEFTEDMGRATRATEVYVAAGRASVKEAAAVAVAIQESVDANIQLMEAGGQRLSQYMQQLNSSAATLNTAMGSIGSEFAKLDQRGYEDKLQRLTNQVRSGDLALKQLFETMDPEGANQYIQTLQRIVQAAQDGELTLERYRQKLEDFQRTVQPGSALGGLAEQLRNGAIDGVL